MNINSEKLFNYTAGFIIFFGIVLLLFTYFSNILALSPDDGHSLVFFYSMKFKQCFTCFIQGANFLPLYKLVLLSIYKIFGFNLPALKFPSLIAGILVLPLSFITLKKIFNNKLIILAILIILSLNYNLLFASTRLKPYIFDVLFTLIIFNTVISLPNNFSVKNILKYSLFALPIFYFSIPNIIVLELYWFIIYVKNIILKNKQNIINLLIFQFITIPFIIMEYLFYINSIKNNATINRVWLNTDFYFSPNSIEAVNSLIQFIYFKFFWWDKIDVPMLHRYTIYAFLAIFFAGSIICIVNSIKNKNLKDFLLIAPVYTFLVISYFNIYPFSNRLITFLIPLIIFITFKVFDFKNYKNIFNAFIIIYLCLFLKHTLSSVDIKGILYDNYYIFTKPNEILYNKINNINANNEIIITFNSICVSSFNSQNIYEIEDYNISDNTKIITLYDKKSGYMIETDDLNTLIKDKDTVYVLTSYEDFNPLKKEPLLTLTEQSLTNSGFKLEANKYVQMFHYEIFKRNK